MTENDKSFKGTSSGTLIFSDSHTFTFHFGDVSWTIFVSSPYGYIKRRGIGRQRGEKMEQSRAFVYTFYAYWLVLIPSAA